MKKLRVAVAVAAAGIVVAGEFKAGFARVDITPPLGTQIAGYFTPRISDGILDPLYVNAVAVGNGSDTVIMISVDFIGISYKYCTDIRNYISERIGIPANNIILAALHQHTSPCVSDLPPPFSSIDSVFYNVFKRKCADAAKIAVDDMSDATLGTASAETDEPIAFVRRYLLDDGTVDTNPSKENCLHLVRRCAEADNTVRLLRFTREGKNDIAIVNFSTHPDVIGGTKFSADWCGFVRKYVESDLIGVSCAFFTGTQGDSNHIDYFLPKEERGRGYEHSKFMGRTVANTVVSLWDKTDTHTDDTVSAKFKIIYSKTNDAGAEKYEECKRFIDDANAGKIDPPPHITELAYASRVINLRTAPIFKPIPLTVFKLGDVVFVGFGGEAFTEYGKAARACAPDKFVVCAVCSNGYEGYFPTKKAFSEGGYEASSSMFSPTLEQEIVAALDDMINKA